MMIDVYPWLAGTLIVGLVLAFGGEYERNMSNHPTHSCLDAYHAPSCTLPPHPGGWPALP